MRGEQELLGVGPGGGALGMAREHPREFDNSLLSVENVDFGHGTTPFEHLAYRDLTIRCRRDLGKMGHDQHLAVTCHLRQRPGQGRCPPTSMAK